VELSLFDAVGIGSLHALDENHVTMAFSAFLLREAWWPTGPDSGRGGVLEHFLTYFDALPRAVTLPFTLPDAELTDLLQASPIVARARAVRSQLRRAFWLLLAAARADAQRRQAGCGVGRAPPLPNAVGAAVAAAVEAAAPGPGEAPVGAGAGAGAVADDDGDGMVGAAAAEEAERLYKAFEWAYTCVASRSFSIPTDADADREHGFGDGNGGEAGAAAGAAGAGAGRSRSRSEPPSQFESALVPLVDFANHARWDGGDGGGGGGGGGGDAGGDDSGGGSDDSSGEPPAPAPAANCEYFFDPDPSGGAFKLEATRALGAGQPLLLDYGLSGGRSGGGNVKAMSGYGFAVDEAGQSAVELRVGVGVGAGEAVRADAKRVQSAQSAGRSGGGNGGVGGGGSSITFSLSCTEQGVRNFVLALALVHVRGALARPASGGGGGGGMLPISCSTSGGDAARIAHAAVRGVEGRGGGGGGGGGVTAINIVCPSGCGAEQAHKVWTEAEVGSGASAAASRYALGSSVCRAALHATGVDGGEFVFSVEQGDGGEDEAAAAVGLAAGEGEYRHGVVALRRRLWLHGVAREAAAQAAAEAATAAAAAAVVTAAEAAAGGRCGDTRAQGREAGAEAEAAGAGSEPAAAAADTALADTTTTEVAPPVDTNTAEHFSTAMDALKQALAPGFQADLGKLPHQQLIAAAANLLSDPTEHGVTATSVGPAARLLRELLEAEPGHRLRREVAVLLSAFADAQATQDVEPEADAEVASAEANVSGGGDADADASVSVVRGFTVNVHTAAPANDADAGSGDEEDDGLMCSAASLREMLQLVLDHEGSYGTSCEEDEALLSRARRGLEPGIGRHSFHYHAIVARRGEKDVLRFLRRLLQLVRGWDPARSDSDVRALVRNGAERSFARALRFLCIGY
jgi:hypothetical protein